MGEKELWYIPEPVAKQIKTLINEALDAREKERQERCPHRHSTMGADGYTESCDNCGKGG